MKSLKRSYQFFSMLFGIILLLFYNVNFAYAGTLFVTNVMANSVTLFDEKTLSIIKEIKVGFRPHEVVVSPDNKIALVANFGDLLNIFPGDSLTSIHIATAAVAKTIKLSHKSRPHGIAFISDSEALVTTQGIQSLLIVDVISGMVKKTLALPGAGVHMVIADVSKKFAYVTNTVSGTICKIDLRSFTVVNETKVGKAVEGLALTKEEDLLFVTARKDNYLAVIRTKDLSVLKTIKTDSGPARVNLFDHGTSAIISNTLSGNAQVLDVASLTITKSFNTNHSPSLLPVPTNVFVRRDQKTAYVTNLYANNIALIDIINGKILKTFKSSCMPDGLAVSYEQ